MDNIESFEGEYRFLSNFYMLPTPIVVEGIMFPSTEHAYQAMKSLDRDDWVRISQLATPNEAKRAGRKLKIRADWDDIKLDVMSQLLRHKFVIPSLREKLLKTGDAVLVEGNWWGDTYWGVCKGVGENHLGKLLMVTRSYYQNTV